VIHQMLVIKQHPGGGKLIQIYDEEWLYAIRAAERSARRSREGPPAQTD
jgi:hypothetical protein